MRAMTMIIEPRYQDMWQSGWACATATVLWLLEAFGVGLDALNIHQVCVGVQLSRWEFCRHAAGIPDVNLLYTTVVLAV